MRKAWARRDTNAIGDRGEAIAALRLQEFHEGSPLFRMAPLGQKWPVSDFAVELVGRPGHLFLLQVKSTQDAIRALDKRLPTRVAKSRLQMLLSSPMPAYLVGVHEPSEQAFLVAPRKARNLSTISTAFSLADRKVRENLQEEVESFWQGVTPPFLSENSRFVD